MIWVHIAFVFLCSRFAIAGVRRREDWWAALNILSVVLNTLALIKASH